MIIIQEHTTKNPISLIGYEAGVCWGSDVDNPDKNYKRGLECIKANHGRTLEFPQIYLTISEYSARCIRELYTHIGGSPTRLQESTRYIDCENFSYFFPESLYKNKEAELIYKSIMKTIRKAYGDLLHYGIPKEDIANLLPLGMMSKVVIRTNLRNLIDMMKVRQCSRAYHEIRKLMQEIKKELSNYSEEWKILCDNYMPIKCEELGYCNEKNSCGKFSVK